MLFKTLVGRFGRVITGNGWFLKKEESVFIAFIWLRLRIANMLLIIAIQKHRYQHINKTHTYTHLAYYRYSFKKFEPVLYFKERIYQWMILILSVECECKRCRNFVIMIIFFLSSSFKFDYSEDFVHTIIQKMFLTWQWTATFIYLCVALFCDLVQKSMP